MILDVAGSNPVSHPSFLKGEIPVPNKKLYLNRDSQWARMVNQKICLFLCSLMFLGSFAIEASTYPKVDAAIAKYDQKIAGLNSAFATIPADLNDKKWVEKKLDHMVEIDQYMRDFAVNTPFRDSYSNEEKTEFSNQIMPKWGQIDSQNTADMKAMLKRYEWFTISAFGSHCDAQAWLLVQHADLDLSFQKDVLRILEKLWPRGETSAKNYAYLYDRVATSANDPAQRQPQRYGTQGTCKGPGAWEPFSNEDPEHLDQRRASVGLGTEAEYIAVFKNICH